MATIIEPTLAPTKPERALPNYRQVIRKQLPDSYFKPDHSHLLWFLFHIPLIAGCLWMLKDHFSFWTAPIISLIIGNSFACLGFLAHDIAHGGTTRNLFLRDLLSGIAFSPFTISPRLWRRWHNAEHHGHTQIEGQDPDHLFTIEFYQTSPVLKFLYKLPKLARNLIVFGSFLFRMNQQTMRMAGTYVLSKDVKTHEKWVIVSQQLTMLAGWILIPLMLGTQVLIWGYVIPILIGNFIAISYIATNHFLNPLADESDVLGTSLTVTWPKWLSWLDSMHLYFGAHVAHHLFPQVPTKYTRNVEKKIAEVYPDRYHAMPFSKAYRLLWDTPWVYEDNHTLIDPRREIREPTLGHGLEKRK